MQHIILRLYAFLSSRAKLRWSAIVALTAILVAMVSQLSFKEDISDFLSLGDDGRRALDIYQDIAGANQLVVLFASNGDLDSVTEAVALFAEAVEERDSLGWAEGMVTQFDMESVAAVQDFVYANIPFFLTDADYARMDSLLATEGYVERQLQADKEMLLFPSGGMLTQNIGRDPLGLFAPVMSRLGAQQQESKFEVYDGYLFTPDMSRAIVTLPSPFGNAETAQNAQLLTLLDECIGDMQRSFPDIEAHVTGGPQIAVGNAEQIKRDSVLSVVLSVLLIAALLFFSFRSARNIAMMALTIGWGWLFAVGGMYLFRDSVSIIVIGISSVILSIAFNYPLHLVAHLEHEPDMRNALKDIWMPLLVGNVTTVGAFLALVPLESTALRDLGTFASLLLVGTVLFVLVFLPHHVRPVQGHESGLLRKVASVRLENKPWVVAPVALLTLVFSWFCFDVEFDSNMSNINYMTDAQRADMEYFEGLVSEDADPSKGTLFVASSAASIDAALDSALARGLDMTSHFLSSKAEQARRLELWSGFLERHGETFSTALPAKAAQTGFAPGAFDAFTDIVSASYSPQEFAFFQPITSTVFAQNVSIDEKAGRYTIVDKLLVEKELMADYRARYPGSFDVESMNGALATTLSDNFNYIGWVCSCIVFFFLWASFRSFKYALISFVPMVISWVWILGLMALLGIKFNIVNIILATFIFGQGDDYTIFVTEGCIHERKHGTDVLSSYKQGILLSAIIMFIGIGTLIFAKHPALYSLAAVTIVGMFCVVFMSWLIPPLMFNILDKLKSKNA